MDFHTPQNPTNASIIESNINLMKWKKKSYLFLNGWIPAMSEFKNGAYELLGGEKRWRGN